jgi:septal ring-binding cell division protein DamX
VTPTQTKRTPPQFTRAPAEKQRHAPVFAFIVLLIIAAAGVAGWWWWKGQQVQPQRAPKPVARPIIKPTPPPPTTTTFASAVPAPQPTPNVAPALSRREPAGEPVQHPKFTIQIELVCQDASLRKATQIGGANVWSVPISYRGQRCHRVFWGRYDTREMAEAATTQIPAALRGSKPVVVAIPQP